MGRKHLLLKETSFARCEALSMADGRLRFECMVDDNLRQAELAAFPQSVHGEGITRVAVNSPGLLLANLAEVFEGGPRTDPLQLANAEAGMARWEEHRTGEGRRTEGGSLLLVAFAQEQPVGYMGMAASFLRQGEDVELFLRLEYVCVHPQARSRGYGLDLALAAGQLASDILVALYSSVRSGTRITSTVCSELLPERGEAMASLVRDALGKRVGRLNQEHRRPSVVVAAPVLLAGY